MIFLKILSPSFSIVKFLFLVFKCFPTIIFLYNIISRVKHVSRMTNLLCKVKTGALRQRMIVKKKYCIDLLFLDYKHFHSSWDKKTPNPKHIKPIFLLAFFYLPVPTNKTSYCPSSASTLSTAICLRLYFPSVLTSIGLLWTGLMGWYISGWLLAKWTASSG